MSKSGNLIALQQREPATPVMRLSTPDVPCAPIEALYVHIPFCFHKCHYCDFYSITKQTPQRMEAFVDLLLAEAELWTRA
ncbi:MAG: hypothetical protein H7144_15175, partial [Burkholderiales bacterium]|nr:hypothetical protein [Phycisphaerae bacterium]